MEKDEYRRIAEAEDGHWWYVGMRRLLEELAGPLALPERGLFLDAGCGPGGNGSWMALRGRVAAIDIMAEAVDFAAGKYPDRMLAQATVEALPFAGQTFDALQSITVLTHSGVAEPVQALREFRRVLKPGGVALIVEPAFKVLRRQHDRVVHAVRRYRRDDLSRLATDAGLEAVRTTYAYSFLFPVALGLALGDRLRQPGVDKSDLERGESGRALFARLAEAEARWLRRGQRIPFGVSAVLVARRPAI